MRKRPPQLRRGPPRRRVAAHPFSPLRQREIAHRRTRKVPVPRAGLGAFAVVNEVVVPHHRHAVRCQLHVQLHRVRPCSRRRCEGRHRVLAVHAPCVAAAGAVATRAAMPDHKHAPRRFNNHRATPVAVGPREKERLSVTHQGAQALRSELVFPRDVAMRLLRSRLLMRSRMAKNDAGNSVVGHKHCRRIKKAPRRAL